MHPVDLGCRQDLRTFADRWEPSILPNVPTRRCKSHSGRGTNALSRTRLFAAAKDHPVRSRGTPGPRGRRRGRRPPPLQQEQPIPLPPLLDVAWAAFDTFPAAARAPHCFRTLAARSKQVPAVGTDGEASGPSEFKKAYASDEGRRRLLWEHEVASSSLAAPTSPPSEGDSELNDCTCLGFGDAPRDGRNCSDSHEV